MFHFPEPWEKAKFVKLPKSGKDLKFPQSLSPSSLLSTTGKPFEKVILNVVQRHIEERSLLNASQFGFYDRHSMTIQYMSLTSHVTSNINNNMSTAAIFLVIEKAFDTTWQPGLLYKLLELKFLTSLIKLLSASISENPTNGISTLSWWWGLRAPETLRAMPAVA
jgi:hypothetical protein